ncbi:RidA family protein [Pseudarthrobacter albicanus]|uniref:RidA family protein n=1 Tax=Pseudarthrobacter albicanus TaxID=2823873 RepID=UPI001BA8C9BE|nr:RidA family protein [Pseudarthrobacter albicanus]
MKQTRRMILPAVLPGGIAENNAYSYGVLDGDVLHISGMVAFAPDGSYVGLGDIQAQATQVFENLTAAVGAARKRYFTGPVPPTSTVVVAPMAREEFLVEISAIARLQG